MRLHHADHLERPSSSQAALIDEASRSFRSRVFRIRYCYEEVSLGEHVVFRLYMANLAVLASSSCLLEYELLYQESDLSK